MIQLALRILKILMAQALGHWDMVIGPERIRKLWGQLYHVEAAFEALSMCALMAGSYLGCIFRILTSGLQQREMVERFDKAIFESGFFG